MNTTDYDKLRADSTAEVDSELDQISNPFDRRAKAEEIRDQANMEIASLRPEREELIAAVALADGKVDPAFAEAVGMGYSYVQKVARAHNSTTVDLQGRWLSAANLQTSRAASTLWQQPGIRERAIETAARYKAAEARRDAALAHLEAAHEAVRTAGGRTRANALRPDFDDVRAKARKEITDEFAALDVGPEERLRLAAEAVDQAEEEMAALLPERDAALNSLAFYTTARGVYLSAGISRQGLVRVQERALGLPRGSKLPARPEQPAAARAAGVKVVANAAEELPQIATLYEAADARHAAAVEIRDAAILTLHAEPYNWSPPRIAEVIDRDPKVVRRVVDPEGNAERRWGSGRTKA
ncbi:MULTISPECIES: hypothetical protein [unclassified Streptomyces]|uniref:hypothetical protein n=1 Tax=unclassified Streptomyces TaxID=2593676 RepID=UPI0035D9998C